MHPLISALNLCGTDVAAPSRWVSTASAVQIIPHRGLLNGIGVVTIYRLDEAWGRELAVSR